MVTQGGNTGLVGMCVFIHNLTLYYYHVGGSTPVFDEVIISLSGLNKVISIDEVSGEVIIFYYT